MHVNDIIIQVCLETYTALLAYSNLQDEENLVCYAWYNVIVVQEKSRIICHCYNIDNVCMHAG